MPKRLNKYSNNTDVTPRTREILSNERGYEDGPPQWLVGRKQRPAQTAGEADDERRKLVKRLRRYAAGHPGAEALADRLDSCAPGQRCMSGACPECSRAFTRWFVASTATLSGDIGKNISILSLVHSDLGVPVGQLTPEHVRKAKKKIQTILINAGATIFVGGMDFSANEDKAYGFAPHFQPQSWILALTDEANAANREIRRCFPKTETTPRPVKITQWDDDLAALGYALKNTFDRRISIYREASDDGFKHACRDTRDRTLRVHQEVELLIALDRAGLHARLHLGGCRVVRTANGPEIRMISNRKGKEQP